MRSSGTLPNPCVHFRSLKLTARGSFELVWCSGVGGVGPELNQSMVPVFGLDSGGPAQGTEKLV